MDDVTPHIFEDRARPAPDANYSEYPVLASDYDDGCRKSLMQLFPNAIDRLRGGSFKY